MRVMYTPHTRWWPHDHTRRTHDATVPAHPSLRHGGQRLALPASRSGHAAPPAPLPLSSHLERRGTSTGLHSHLCDTLPTLYGSGDPFGHLLHRKRNAPARGGFVMRAFRVQWRWHTPRTIAATTGASSSMQVMDVGGVFA